MRARREAVFAQRSRPSLPYTRLNALPEWSACGLGTRLERRQRYRSPASASASASSRSCPEPVYVNFDNTAECRTSVPMGVADLRLPGRIRARVIPPLIASGAELMLSTVATHGEAGRTDVPMPRRQPSDHEGSNHRSLVQVPKADARARVHCRRRPARDRVEGQDARPGVLQHVVRGVEEAGRARPCLSRYALSGLNRWDDWRTLASPSIQEARLRLGFVVICSFGVIGGAAVWEGEEGWGV